MLNRLQQDTLIRFYHSDTDRRVMDMIMFSERAPWSSGFIVPSEICVKLFQKACRLRRYHNLTSLNFDRHLFRVALYYSREQYEGSSIKDENLELGATVLEIDVRNLSNTKKLEKIWEGLVKKAGKDIIEEYYNFSAIALDGDEDTMCVTIMFSNHRLYDDLVG